MTTERYRRYMATDKGRATRQKASRNWWRRNRETANADRNVRVRNRAKKHRMMCSDIKLQYGCADCGYDSHPQALDFDHINPADKKYSVAKMVGKYSEERLLTEIEKCEVRCANCHRIKTAQERQK